MLWFIPWPRSLSSLTKQRKQTIVKVQLHQFAWSSMHHSGSCSFLIDSTRTCAILQRAMAKINPSSCISQNCGTGYLFRVDTLASWDSFAMLGACKSDLHSSVITRSGWMWLVNRLHSLGLRWTQPDSTSQRRKMRAGLEPLVMATSPLGALPCLAAQFEGA